MPERTPKQISDIPFPFDPANPKATINLYSLYALPEAKKEQAAINLAARFTKTHSKLFGGNNPLEQGREIAEDGPLLYREVERILYHLERSLEGEGTMPDIPDDEIPQLLFSDYHEDLNDYEPDSLTLRLNTYLRQRVYKIEPATMPLPDLTEMSNHDRELFLRLLGFDQTNKVSISLHNQQMDMYFTRLTPTLGLVIADGFTQEEAGVYKKITSVPMILEPEGETGDVLRKLVSRFLEEGGEIPKGSTDSIVKFIKSAKNHAEIFAMIDAGVIDSYERAQAVINQFSIYRIDDDLAYPGKLINAHLVRAYIDRWHERRYTLYVEAKPAQYTDAERLQFIRKRLEEAQKKVDEIKTNELSQRIEELYGNISQRVLQVNQNMEKILLAAMEEKKEKN